MSPSIFPPCWIKRLITLQPEGEMQPLELYLWQRQTDGDSKCHFGVPPPSILTGGISQLHSAQPSPGAPSPNLSLDNSTNFWVPHLNLLSLNHLEWFQGICTIHACPWRLSRRLGKLTGTWLQMQSSPGPWATEFHHHCWNLSSICPLNKRCFQESICRMESIFQIMGLPWLRLQAGLIYTPVYLPPILQHSPLWIIAVC